MEKAPGRTHSTAPNFWRDHRQGILTALFANHRYHGAVKQICLQSGAAAQLTAPVTGNLCDTTVTQHATSTS